MKKIIPVFILLILCTCMIFAQNSKKVLIIGMDGCRVDALLQAFTPNLDDLVSNGLASFDALNNDITISGPGWSAILCGVWSDKHLVTNNSFTINNYDQYPSIFKYVETHNPELRTVSFCHWSPINDYIINEDVDFKLNVDSDELLAGLSRDYLLNNEVDLMFLHFDDIDHAGHVGGFSPNNPEYIESIETTDFHIGTILQGLKSRENYVNEDWLILVTTDHGGLGTSHGGNSLEEQNVFFIASSNTIDEQVIQADSIILSDEVSNCLGHNQELQFNGVSDYAKVNHDTNYPFDKDFSIECRVRTNTTGDFSIIGNKDWDTGLNPGFVISFKYPSGPEWKINIGDGNNRVDLDSGGLIADNQWHTLSVSFDRDGYMKMYQDGTLLDSADISNINEINPQQGLWFGSDINQAYNFKGAISEVRLWDGLLSQNDIEQYACKYLDANHQMYNHLAGYWKTNEGSDNILIDESIYQNNANIEGAEWIIPDSIVIYDYSNTPRLVDVPFSALEHMCIPIDTVWQLDGISWVNDCNISNIQSVQEVKNLLYPNPFEHEIKISNIFNHHQNTFFDIYNLNGTFIEQIKLIDGSIEQIEIEPGAYIFKSVDHKLNLTQLMIKN